MDDYPELVSSEFVTDALGGQVWTSTWVIRCARCHKVVTRTSAGSHPAPQQCSTTCARAMQRRRAEERRRRAEFEEHLRHDVDPATTLDHHRSRWLTSTYTWAEAKGITDQIGELARAYGAGSGGITSHPDPHGNDRFRVLRDGLYVIVSPTGIILACGRMAQPAAIAPQSAKPSGPKQSRPAASRGPATWGELEEWLTEEGCTITGLGSGHRAVIRDGERIAVVPSTPSEYRGLMNAVADIRRRTGLKLRK